MDQWAKIRYLDASALVKLVIDEGDHQEVRSIFYSDTNFCATSLCLAEALGVIKNKWNRSLITEEQYFKSTRELLTRQLLRPQITPAKVPSAAGL